MLLASVSPALTEEAAMDYVTAMSAAEVRREYRAPDVALMHCDFFGYIPEPPSFRHAKPDI